MVTSLLITIYQNYGKIILWTNQLNYLNIMERTFNIKLTEKEIKSLMGALGNLPFKDVYEIIGKINDEVNKEVVKQNSNIKK